ncbi:hypothetical protein ACEWY4_004778 [Coilia grayii]|uniref:Uncharacterized protein n=1 Tax=Coilia grayii TaxID=363190 RepID=A0ABD1KMR7_9TELE
MYEDALSTQHKLHTLILTGNPLAFMSYDAFSGLDSLVRLIMPQTAVTDLEDIPIAELQLDTLDVSSGSIHNLEGLAALNFKKMTALNLARNNIASLRASDLQAFRGTSGDVEVSFQSNNIISVERGVFGALRFRSLDFCGCFARADVSVVLKGLEGVATEKLNLGTFNDAPHRHIKTESLCSLCNTTVTHLSFERQRWEDLSNATFQCLGGLRALDMTEMSISHLPDNITTMGKLAQLTLDRNKFGNVCDVNAHNFPSLTSLSMQGIAEFTKGHCIFNDDCFQGLSQLEYLDLSHSTVHADGLCCERQLKGLGQLRLLNLSYNDAMRWGALPFAATPQLRHLDCSHLSVTLNSSAPFRNLALLQTLNLSRTSLSVTHPRLLEGLKSLVHLDLRGNPISEGVVSDPEIFKHVPDLESLILAECNLTGIGGNLFHALTKLTHADLSANHLAKLSTSAFFSLASIRLNYAHNLIELVDISSVQGLGPSSLVDLSFNPLTCNCSNIKFIDWVKANVDKLVHADETLCSGSHQKISDVTLHCYSVAGAVAFGVTMLVVALTIAAVSAFKKWKTYNRYTQL